MVNTPGKGGIFNDTCSNNLCSEEPASSLNTDGLFAEMDLFFFVNKTKSKNYLYDKLTFNSTVQEHFNAPPSYISI